MKCSTCNGYGFHAMCDTTPMGRLDALDGMPTIVCPECKANPNPIKKTNTNLLKENEIPLKSIVNHPINKQTEDFIRFFENLGVTFIDATDEYTKVKSSKKDVRKNKTNKSR